MHNYPPKLTQVLDDFKTITDRSERTEVLLELADSFQEVPPDIATRPYPPENRVEFCESEAYVWAREQPDQTLKFYFAVENPQGLSAKALSTLLDQTLSGQAVGQVSQVRPEIVFTIFGRDISMGKGQGLTGIVSRVKYIAKQYLARRAEESS
jgi:cysteine desulfuration protein SufE